MIAEVYTNISSDTIGFLHRVYGLPENRFTELTTVVEVRNIKGMNHSAVKEMNSLLPDEDFILEAFKSTDGSFALLIAENQNLRLKKFIKKLAHSRFSDIASVIEKTVEKFSAYGDNSYTIDGFNFDFSKSYVMGIVNVTPDSFSDGGKYFAADTAAEHGLRLIDEGADIIDVGGESTRPGADPVDLDEELRRTIPVIEEIKKKRKNAVISIDTYKSEVARQALLAGASIVNDISGAVFDKNMLDVVAEQDAAVILMHTKDKPKVMQDNLSYINIITDLYDFLSERADAAKSAGISKIFIDPGIGFGKTVEHNLEIINRLADFKSIGYPILVGISRKSFLGKILDLPVESRENASLVAETVALYNGARIIRTHNAVLAKQAVSFINSVL